jgi:uncharacterized membrane protein YedE/YeeE
MPDASVWWLVGGGLAVGASIGFAARYARLCSFGAIEDALMGEDTRRLRVFALALGIAILGTQALIIAGWLDVRLTTYAPPALPVVAIAIGGVMFGLGMALVGTCGFGSLVRLGNGDLRSLVVILIFGAAAYATLRGFLAGLRIDYLEALALPMPDATRAELASVLSRAFGADVRPLVAPALGLGLGLGLCWLAIGDPRLRRTPRLMAAGTVLGLAVVAGWLITITASDEFAAAPRPQSLTFVSTVGKTLYAGIFHPVGFADFGVATVLGVVIGSFLAGLVNREWRWEAFDDDREMRRHMSGAVLMGIGGILAGGCTVGQGITAGSVLSLSWPLAVGGIVVGARLGIAILVEGSTRDALGRGWRSLRGRAPAE